LFGYKLKVTLTQETEFNQPKYMDSTATRRLNVEDFVTGFNVVFPTEGDWAPWNITLHLPGLLEKIINLLEDDYYINEGIAIHKTAIVENNVTFRAPVIVEAGCFIGANAYLRHGVYIGQAAIIGPDCEVKTSIIMPGTTLAHFNYVGDSIIGREVNMEAGVVIANHYNERANKQIEVMFDGRILPVDTEKFGALIGDYSKIGANAVLSPGTLLEKHSVVARLQLVEQVKPEKNRGQSQSLITSQTSLPGTLVE
jgi:NDP-sugar pyrophosphorylase family protein